MTRLFLLLIILGTFTFITSVFGGISATFNGYGNTADILIKSSLAGTISLPIMGVIALYFPRPARKPDDNLPVNIWRRSAALYIDFTVVMSILVPPITLLMLFLEKVTTGKFVWSVHRTVSRPTDLLFIPIMIIVFVLMFYYFYKHAKSQRATAGQFIMGYKIVPEDSFILDPKYVQRTFSGAFAGCIWPITLIAMNRRKDGVFWWDKDTNTRAVRIS